MKKIISIFLFSSIVLFSYSQLPNINLKDVNGDTKNLSKFSNNGKPMIISFWATWCKPCKAELNTIAEEYDDWHGDAEEEAEHWQGQEADSVHGCSQLG